MLAETNINIIKLEKLFFIDDPGALCRLPYPGHPRGCPNWNKSPNCPPHAPKLQDKYDLDRQSYFVVRPFNIGVHKERMKSLHPEWSDAQCACCLYWQKGIKKELQTFVKLFVKKLICDDLSEGFPLEYDNYSYELIPEAMGLNIFETAPYHGIPIERNPQKILYKIAFVGVLK